MNGIRKVIGLLIIIFIGVPVLISIIWAVGITRAVVSPEFLSEMPREIITKIPEAFKIPKIDITLSTEFSKYIATLFCFCKSLLINAFARELADSAEKVLIATGEIKK